MALFLCVLASSTAALTACTAQNHARTEGHDTDRYRVAANLLGSDKIDSRYGGVYLLESVAVSSPSKRSEVYDLLASFVREHAVKTGNMRADQPATDIQSALTVLGRRMPSGGDLVLDLHDAYLKGADLRDADLKGADLIGTDLRDADLRGAEFAGADISGADLRGVRGISANELRRQTRTDPATRF